MPVPALLLGKLKLFFYVNLEFYCCGVVLVFGGVCEYNTWLKIPDKNSLFSGFKLEVTRDPAPLRL